MNGCMTIQTFDVACYDRLNVDVSWLHSSLIDRHQFTPYCFFVVVVVVSLFVICTHPIPLDSIDCVVHGLRGI